MLTPNELIRARSDDPKTWPRKVVIYAVLLDDHWLSTTQVHTRLQQLCEHLGRAIPVQNATLKILRKMAKAGWVDVQPRVDQQTHAVFGRKDYHWKPREFDWDGNYIWPFWKTDTKGITLNENANEHPQSGTGHDTE